MIPILQGKKLSQLLPLDTLTGAENFYLVGTNGVSYQSPLTSLIALINAAGGGALQASENFADVPNKTLARQNLGLKTMATQDANAVTISGGSINGTQIGNTTPAYGRFTELIVTTSLTIPAGSITVASIQGNIPNSKLENSSINVDLQNGLGGDASVELGGTLTLSIDEVDGGNF